MIHAKTNATRSRSLLPLAAVGLAGLALAVASCAQANDSVDVTPDASTVPESGSPLVDVDADAALDASCDDASDGSCTTRELTCAEADFCAVPTNTDARFALLSVWGSSANDVWAVGSGGTIAHWDGAAWARIPFKGKDTLRAVGGSSATDVWIVSAPNLIAHVDGFHGDATKLEIQPPRDEGDPTNWLGSTLTYIWNIGPGEFFVGGPTTRGYPQNSLWRHYGTPTNPLDATSNWDVASTYCISGQVCPDSNGIWGTSANDLWVIGQKGGVRHSNGAVGNGGGANQWTLLKNTFTADNLLGIWGSSNSDIWIVGEGGTIRHWSNDASREWEIVPSPTTETLRAVWGSGPRDVWATGDNGTIIHWDGDSWRPATATFPVGPKPRLYRIWGSGPNDVWIVGEATALHFTGPKAPKGGTQ
ncbi:Type IV fimbrial biogenesis protein PilY1 [Labilithrix luteola]|uniref:Type IV fimbrial biogenesis protein PilY1 n=1 Tax=Labilithrix luteola TaxID=1391654 RepID=A0A0K1PTP9_9BACT|nr:hypothetical protein [Labilithrix luteola]AKU96509.1 Type IV fimbrial biogenesis protein PilY1 [Labilithrix luteola]